MSARAHSLAPSHAETDLCNVYKWLQPMLCLTGMYRNAHHLNPVKSCPYSCKALTLICKPYVLAKANVGSRCHVATFCACSFTFANVFVALQAAGNDVVAILMAEACLAAAVQAATAAAPAKRKKALAAVVTGTFLGLQLLQHRKRGISRELYCCVHKLLVHVQHVACKQGAWLICPGQNST